MNPISSHQPTTHQATPVSCPFDYMRNLSPDASLRLAVAKNDFDGVSYVLDHSEVDFSALDYCGQNPIHSAIDLGRDDNIVYLLIERSEGSNAIHELDRNGYTPLMLAVEQGKISLATFMIKDRQATYSDGNDATCHPDRLSRKQQTLGHTRLLVESGGDIAEAHRLALGRGIDSFEQSFMVQHNSLKNACRAGDIEAARVIVAAGADPSFVLMRTLNGSGLSVSPERATITRNLLAAGAHPTATLKHALSTKIDYHPVRTLLMLGASSNVLKDFILERATAFDKIFLHSINKKDWSNALKNAALQGDKAAVQFWVRSGAVKPDPTLISLAKNRRVDAIKLLLDSGVDGHSTLLRLVDEGKIEAVRSLISAGANVSKLLQEMMGNHQRGLRIGIDKLQTLIRAGADMSQLLLASTNGKDRLHVAKILLAAGANAEAAVALCPENTRAEVKKTLALAAQDAAAVDRMMRDAGSSDITLVESILVAKGFIDQPTRRPINEGLTKTADRLQTEGHQAEADLLRAVLSTDWNEIKSRVAGNSRAAVMVLLMMLQHHDVPSSRLLVRAGTNISAAIDWTISKIQDNNKAIVLIARLLLAADDLAHRVLGHAIDSKGTPFAKELIKLSKFNIVDMFGHLTKAGNMAAIVKLNPLHTIEPAQTSTTSSESLAFSLISAGFNNAHTFFEALDAGDPGTAGVLGALIKDNSVALARALSDAQASVAETLLVLGADLNVALREVDPEKMALVETLLPADAGS
ncbi:ankyrin repeat domain-containing protein [Bordetella muralis]|uniref:ankyrin repeat domain-containing protein n=1 Tax=Bordetella muralis TaxID=1649130 RepID=UPI0039EF23CF